MEGSRERENDQNEVPKSIGICELGRGGFFWTLGTLAEWRCVPLQSLCIFGVTHAGTTVWWAYVLLQALDPEKDSNLRLDLEHVKRVFRAHDALLKEKELKPKAFSDIKILGGE